MAVKIASNIPALTAERHLAQTGNDLSHVFERLSSGKRINRASDDAASLAIADSLNSKSRLYSRAIQNLNDGISTLSIADAAVSSLTTITTRIIELAEQSGNGTYSSRQRTAMDKEAQALRTEYTRIAQTTTFNGVNLLDGSVAKISLQAGYGSGGVL